MQNAAEVTQVRAANADTVLLVDDDDSIRMIVQRVLEKAGYVVLAASSAETALQVAEAHADPIDLIVADLMLPGVKGPKMVERLREQQPSIGVLYLSGYTDVMLEEAGMLDARENLLEKPFGLAALMKRVRESIDAARAVALLLLTASIPVLII